MALFGLGKKKEETKSLCCCGGTCTPDTMEKAEEKKTGMGVKVLGGGCAKCNQLEAATVEALTELGMDTTIEHIKDWGEIGLLWSNDNSCFSDRRKSWFPLERY